MNYRHAYHAGNFADVLKHAVIGHIVSHLSRKEAPFRVIDTHAGVGLYDLAAEEAVKTGEWRGGIGRVLAAPTEGALAEFLAPLMQVVRAVNGGDRIEVYPGSPLVATVLARIQDRFVFNEKHPLDADRLEAGFAADRRVRVTRDDGYTVVKSQLPPQERRGLTVIDPPYEEAGEFDRLLAAIADADRRFATGTVLTWYPLKAMGDVARFHDRVAASGIARVLRIEQWVCQPGGEGPLAGAGLLVVNPPWRLKEAASAAMPALADLLADGDGAGGRVDWLVPERS